MSIYTLIVIIGTLMIIGGISLAATPLMTFVTAGNLSVRLFCGSYAEEIKSGLLGLLFGEGE